MRSRWVASAAMITVAGLALAGCAGSSGDEGGDDNTLTLWHYESETSAMGVAWAEAIKVFEEETGAKVEFEEKSFEQIRSTASQVLNSNEAPDILEYNKGNATAGLLSSEGLLTPLTEQVEEFGWDDKLAPALQTTARYSEDGVMGSGEWYGVPNYGEYVTMYYNKDAFAAQGIEIPTTREELDCPTGGGAQGRPRQLGARAIPELGDPRAGGVRARDLHPGRHGEDSRQTRGRRRGSAPGFTGSWQGSGDADSEGDGPDDTHGGARQPARPTARPTGRPSARSAHPPRRAPTGRPACRPPL